MHWKDGSYYRVSRNKWTRLARSYHDALRRYAELESSSTLWPELVNLQYADYRASSLAANTLKQYDSIRPRLIAGFGDFDPHEITSAHVGQFLELYRSTPNIANRMLSVLRAVFDKGCRTGACSSNPAHGLKRFKEKQRDRYLTDDEFAAIRAHANIQTRLILDVCYLTAQRIGDVLQIRHEHVRPEGIYFEPQKTGRQKKLLVEMTPELARTINEAKALHKVMCPWLFHPRGKRTPYSYAAIKDNFNRACSAASVEGATIHDVRAKSLTDVDDAGGDATSLAAHSTRATTLRYLRNKQTRVVAGPRRAGNS